MSDPQSIRIDPNGQPETVRIYADGTMYLHGRLVDSMAQVTAAIPRIHEACANDARKLAAMTAELERAKLQAVIDQRKIAAWRVAAELGEEIVRWKEPSPGKYDRWTAALATAKGTS